MLPTKSIVYIRRSEHPPRYYTGLTSNLSTRLGAQRAISDEVKMPS
jgi:predicted GIY-YIG superfamily endonuclease